MRQCLRSRRSSSALRDSGSWAIVLGVLALLSAPGSAFQFERLLADDGALGDNFGRAVAIDGNTAVVGARLSANPENFSGAVYVFTRDAGGAWSEPTELTPDDGSKGDQFGFSVALQRDTLLVGANGDDSETYAPFAVQTGSFYVFERDANGAWIQKQKLRANDEFTTKQFGSALAVHGDLAVVGARWSPTVGGIASGSAYVFRRTAGVWAFEAQLHSADIATVDRFGSTVAVHDGTVVVGALGHDHFPESVNIGSAYVFEESEIAGVWEQTAELIASDYKWGDNFGYAVAVNGDRILSGAPFGNSTPELESGAAYLFERVNGIWVEREKLLPNDAQADDFFGAAVALSETHALVGADLEDAKQVNAGAAYLFTEERRRFTRQVKLAPSDVAVADWFGHSVALDGETVLLGAPLTDPTEGTGDAGAAYVLPLSQLLPWSDLAQGLAGSAGVPSLTGLGPQGAGGTLDLRLDDGRPETLAFAVIGLSDLSQPLKGGVLVPSPDLVIAGEVDAEGRFSLDFTPPAFLMSGDELRFQVWVLDDSGPRDFVATNALLAKLP